MSEPKRSFIARYLACMMVALAALSLLIRVLGGRDFTLVPWPVALIALLLGLFVLRQIYEHPRNRIARERSERRPEDWRNHA